MTLAKFLKATAGAAGEEATYVEDVFSTYLYTGNGSTQSIENGIALGDFGVGTSTEFNGTSDYLSRSSDLTGNTNSKTFTFSMWVYRPVDQAGYYYEARTTGGFYRFFVSINTAETVRIVGKNSGGTTIFDFETTSTVPFDTWTNVILSIDLANTSNRHIYINDTAASALYLIYTNDSIAFSGGTHGVAADGGGSSKVEGRIAHLYLDYTYRNLSVEANRRLFIDANGGSTAPSTLSALNPILYLPMTEDYSIGENLGTGGDFTVNGSPTIVQSGTQYEAGYGQGGLVWNKHRSTADAHGLWDTARGVNAGYLQSEDTGAQSGSASQLTSFNANGFTLPSSGYWNTSGTTYASWTFRKAPKFFDVVTYTGDGSSNKTISHNLGSTPGCIIVKCTSAAYRWNVWHRNLTNATSNTNPSNAYMLFLNTNDPQQLTSSGGIADVNGSTFDVGGVFANNTGETFVAYLFAHDAGGFGDDGDQNIISCGSFTPDAFGNATVNLGYEAQWILYKGTSGAGGTDAWVILDNMRGWDLTTSDKRLFANYSSAEGSSSCGYPTATGFNVENLSASPYIYIAIRRGPMKTPESGTEVFAVDTFKGTTTLPNYNSGFVTDMGVSRVVNSSQNWNWGARVTGPGLLQSDGTPAEITDSNKTWDFMDGYNKSTSSVNSNNYSWMFRRAPGFFDVVAYTGNAVSNTARNHNLGVEPELMIFKGRSLASNWPVYCKYLNNQTSQNNWQLRLNDTLAQDNNSGVFGNQLPTASVFYTAGNSQDINFNGQSYVVYLFASLDGVSKIGSFVQTPPTNTVVNCGFSNGARFVLLKRINSTGSWYLWDSVRGIVSGVDPYVRLENTGPQITTSDSLIPNSSGFETNGNWLDGGTYIYLAIA